MPSFEPDDVDSASSSEDNDDDEDNPRAYEPAGAKDGPSESEAHSSEFSGTDVNSSPAKPDRQPEVPGSRWTPVQPIRSQSRVSLTPVSRDVYANSTVWEEDDTPSNGLITMTYMNRDGSKRAFKVYPRNRFIARESLCFENVQLNLIRKKMCRMRCKKKCCEHVDADAILRLREKILVLEGNDQKKRYLVGLLREMIANNSTIEYRVGGFPVCYDFFRNACVVSKDLLGTLRGMALDKSNVLVPVDNQNRLREALQEAYCVGFWREYFEDNCMTSDRETLYWPTGITIDFVYDEKFPSYWKETVKAQGLSGEDAAAMPSLSTFKRMRKLPEFTNVKKKKEHHHLKCTLCSRLGQERRKGFATKEAQLKNKREHEQHAQNIKDWRRLEEQYTRQAVADPSRVNIFKIDDTEVIKFPHTGGRTPKAGAKLYKLPVVPCLLMMPHTGEKMYLYSLKGPQKKGANRFCTTMHAAFMAVKNGPSAAAKARGAVLIGDNYNENRNLTNLAFSTDVVHRGIYDWTELLLGELGHTHIGNDRDHKLHNQDCGRTFSNTLVDFVRKFPTTWVKADTKPKVGFIAHQFDWDKFYSGVKIPLAGISQRTDNAGGPYVIKAFRVARQPSGIVEVFYRTSYEKDAPWHGRDGPGSAGFVCLRSRPSGVPRLIRNGAVSNYEDILKDFNRHCSRSC
jgi:hypothetical protein